MLILNSDHLTRSEAMSKSDRDTGYREVHKLPPDHALTLSANGQTRLWRHHHWRDDAPDARRRDPQWVEAYREVLEEAIRCRMHSDFPLGSENSGGIDSATITAYLAHFLGTPGDRLHSFGFALCEQEPAYILETSQAKGITHNYLITARGAFDDRDARIDQALQVLGYPEEHGNGSGHIPFYRECQLRGIGTLFSGFGGDEVDLHHTYMETARYDAPYRRINAFILDGLLQMPYIATRLENCTLMAASHGIDYRWPLWDVRMVQQYLSTPSIENVGPKGIGRYLHRRAIDAVVPKRVAWKPTCIPPWRSWSIGPSCGARSRRSAGPAQTGTGLCV